VAEEIPIEADPALMKWIKSKPEVQTIHPFATKNAILKTTDEIEGVLLKGLDPTYDFSILGSFLQPGGRWIHFNDSTYSREIVISAYTAKQLQLKVSDRVLIYFIRPDGSLRPDKLTIVGIYKTGIEEYDKIFAIGDIKLIRRLNDWKENEIGGYEVFLKDFKKMDEVSTDIYSAPQFTQLWETKTVKELAPNIFDWLYIIGNNGNVLIVIMIVIAAINFITCLIILVLERVRMIGLLKAVGASNWTIQKIFLYHSALITFSGIIIGILAALGLLFLQQKTGFIHLDEEAYYMSTAAVTINWWQVAMVAAGTLILAFLVLLIPSFLVKKIQPIKAIRFN